MTLYLTRSPNVQHKTHAPRKKFSCHFLAGKLDVLPDELARCTRSANGQELFLVPERKWKHVTQPLGDLLALYGMFRHVSNDRLDLDRDAFWRYDPPRVIGLPLTHLLGGHGLRWLLPSRVLPRKGTG